MQPELPPELTRAMDELLPVSERSGDLAADLAEAARRSRQRRIENTRDGGAVLAAMHDVVGLSWDQIAYATGIPVHTAQRWAEPPTD